MKWSPFVNIRRSLTAQARLKTIELSNGTAEKPLRVFFCPRELQKKKLTTRRRDQSIKARPWQCCDVAPRCGAYGVLALLHACSAPRVGLRSPLLCPPPLPSTSRPRQRDALVGKDPGVAAFRPCCSREELPPPQQRLIAYGLLVCLRGIRFSAPRPHCRLMDRAHQGAAQRRQEGAGLLPGARRRPAVWQAALPCGCDVNI